ncbi:MAG: amidohydrolase [Desulfohalobiaceae bacterium]|nr:amidohydrolase [Desulfohalobiaceae bacterium]
MFRIAEQYLVTFCLFKCPTIQAARRLVMIIDGYTHILPEKYQTELEKKATFQDPKSNTARYARTIPTLVNLEARFRVMDSFDEYMQVISVAAPPVYNIAPPETAVELCRIANDQIAETVFRYPDRFAAGIACLPMTDMEAALQEADRAVKELRLRAVEINTDITGKPLDSPEFYPLFEKMVELDRPIFLHPMREMSTPDYETEEYSKYRLWTQLGWPYVTSLAMARLVYSGIMERLPRLKIITHHCGGITPFLAGRIDWSYDFNEMRMGHRDVYLKEKPIDYFRRFYFDTAVNGHTPSLQCGLSFAGIDQMLFATDLPFDNQNGHRLIRDTIQSIEEMGLSDADKSKLYRNNLIKLLRLPLCSL